MVKNTGIVEKQICHIEKDSHSLLSLSFLFSIVKWGKLESLPHIEWFDDYMIQVKHSVTFGHGQYLMTGNGMLALLLYLSLLVVVTIFYSINISQNSFP